VVDDLADDPVRPAPGDLTMTELPPVSVFMAVRDAAGSLAESVRRVFTQDYAGDLELVLAVGPSADRTREIADELAATEPRLVVVDNDAGYTPHGLNAAIAVARYDLLVRVDGHALIPTDYVSRLVVYLTTTDAANVGGRMVATGSGPVDGAVAVAYGSRFGLGGGAFHVGGAAGPAPTVYLGAFHRSALEAVGGYDEYFLRAQDWELNQRLREAGHTIWFDPEIAVGYQPRDSWRDLARQQYRTGGWRRRVIARHPGTASVRYLAPPVLVLGLLLGVVAAVLAPFTSCWLLLGVLAPVDYALAITAVGLYEGRGKPWPVRVRVPVAMAIMHVAWGTGFLLRAK